MIKIFCVFLVIVCSSCDKSEDLDSDMIGGLPPGYEEVAYLKIVDSQGLDLLNSTNPKSLNVESIKIFHLVNGERKLINDSSYPFSFYAEGSPNNYLHIPLLKGEIGEMTTTILKFDKSEEIFTCENSLINSFERISKIWINDILLLDNKEGVRRFDLTLVK